MSEIDFMGLIYREIDPSNFKEVSDFILLHEYSYRDSASTYTPDSGEKREQLSKKLQTQLLRKNSELHCLAAFDGAEMIGAHYLHRMTLDQRPACHIHGLWVHPGYQQRGVARKLKAMGEAWAKRTGCEFMDANVRVTNRRMIALNESLGYTVERLNFRKAL